MKKIYTFLILVIGLSYLGISQPTASVTIENPRIDGSTFYWDVYFMRTNNDANWYVLGQATLGDCSWYWDFNITDLTNYQIVAEDPTLFPAANYTNTIGVIGGQLRINTAYTLNVIGTNIVEDVWYKAFSCSADITGTATNESDHFWDMVNTGLTTANNNSITEADYDSDCDIALNTNCWTGSAGNGYWDDSGNWSEGSVPAGENIIYPYDLSMTQFTGYSALPPPTPYGTVGDLRVNHHAEFIIPFNSGIVVTGDILLKGGPRNIVLDASTAEAPGTPSSFLIPEGTITYNSYAVEDGHIEVHRTLYYEATDLDYYHHQVAAPVGNVVLGDWDMQHFYSYAYEFRADQTWWNIHEITRPTNSGYGFILSLYGSSGFATSTQDIVFYDNLELGTVNPAINPGAGVFSLIGNPYTAPISWDYMHGLSTNMSDAVWVWNPDAGSYVSYNATTSTGDASAEFIQPGQAFFVEATTGAPTFSITPAARTQNIEPYLKSSKNNGLTLYTEGGNTTHDKTYIKFVDMEEATGAYENSIDVLEWPSSYGEMATELFTVSSDNQNLIIDVRPLSPDLMSVPLSFKAAIDAEYTLGADLESIESFSPGTEIFLEDLFHPEQAWIDLREFNTYSFNASPADNYERFMIHFHIKDFGINELAQNPISIYSDRTDAIIQNNSSQQIKEIHIFDVAGNLMTIKSGVNEEMTRMFVSSNTGYYVVKVITDKAVYSEKVLITK